MKNEYEVFGKINVVAIKCLSKETGEILNAYVDLMFLPYLQTMNVEWRVWDKSKEIGTIVNKDGKNENLYLKKVISNLLFGGELHCKRLDDTEWDYRRENLFSYEGIGQFSKTEVQVKFDKMKRELVTINQLLEQNGHSNITENNIRMLFDPDNKCIVINENQQEKLVVSQYHATQIYHFLKSHPSYVLRES